ncbi:MAG TPA: GNAT family N-acetyltransferase [Syntrophomonadaceae bacterium]|nr:GNAT family N-acetyltransferase [Syntrophomonadaceae bacterium]HQD91133.1 GNAT family N-acetyltransferase [Syntrophomonadaceae bacterium]
MLEPVRLIRYDELDKLLNLYQHLHPEDPDVRDSEVLESLWTEIFNDPNLYYLVIEDNGEIISSCTIAIIKNLTRNLRPYGLIENMITHPNYRKKGLGTKVLHKAVEIAKENNCYKIMLLTSSKSEDTFRFYRKAGFVQGVKTGFIIQLA